MKTFIAFTGVKGSGKTTSFKLIKEFYPEVQEVTLAAKLKDACSSVLKIPRSSFDDPAVKEKDLDVPVYLNQQNVEKIIQLFAKELDSVGVKMEFNKHVRQHIGMILESPRRAAQYVGTEVLRTVYSDIHCLGATFGLSDNGVFIVTDMRFPNEFGYFETRFPKNFYPLYVANYAAESQLGPNPHASEKYVLELAKKCSRIDNNGTMEELKARVLKTVQDILDKEGYQRRPYETLD